MAYGAGGSSDASVDVDLDAVWPDAGERSRRFRAATSLTTVNVSLPATGERYGRSPAATDALGPAVSVKLTVNQAATAGSLLTFTLSVALVVLD